MGSDPERLAKGVVGVCVLGVSGLPGCDGELEGVGREPLMEPDTAPALCTGTLDQMVDQVTQSIMFVQKQYPGNQWVPLQTFLLSDWVGGQWIHLLGCSPAIPSGFGAEGKWDPLDTGLWL